MPPIPRSRLPLVLFLAGLSTCATLCLPDWLYGPPVHPWLLPGFHLSAVLVLGFVVGLPRHSLDWMLALSASGAIYTVRWSPNPFLTILLSGAKWLTCFLAGPYVFAGAAFLYWEWCDHPSLFDYLILAELSFAGFTFWTFLLLALTDPVRLRDSAPAAVGRWTLCRALRILVVVTSAFLLLLHGWLLTAGLTEENRTPMQGLLILIVGARLLSSRGDRVPNQTERAPETHWYQCLWYPFRASRLWWGLALFLTGLTVCAATFLPHWLDEPTTSPLWLAAFHVCGVLGLVFAVGLPCSALDCVLGSAAAGQTYHVRWWRNPFLVILCSGAKWLACFFAGPCVFAVAWFLYWLECGDASLLDVLILAELGVVGVAYWIFLLLAVTEHRRREGLAPAAVADLAQRLGWRVVVVVAAALLLLAHGGGLAGCVEKIHRKAETELSRFDTTFFLGTLRLPKLGPNGMVVEEAVEDDPFVSIPGSIGSFRVMRGDVSGRVLGFMDTEKTQFLPLPPRGLLMLAVGWGSGAFFSMFFCRLLGLWCFRSRAENGYSFAPNSFAITCLSCFSHGAARATVGS